MISRQCHGSLPSPLVPLWVGGSRDEGRDSWQWPSWIGVGGAGLDHSLEFMRLSLTCTVYTNTSTTLEGHSLRKTGIIYRYILMCLYISIYKYVYS